MQKNIVLVFLGSDFNTLHNNNNNDNNNNNNNNNKVVKTIWSLYSSTL